MEISYQHKYQIIIIKYKIRSGIINNGMLDMASFYFFAFVIFRVLRRGITDLDNFYEVDYLRTKQNKGEHYSLKLVTFMLLLPGYFYFFLLVFRSYI